MESGCTDCLAAGCAERGRADGLSRAEMLLRCATLAGALLGASVLSGCPGGSTWRAQQELLAEQQAAAAGKAGAAAGGAGAGDPRELRVALSELASGEPYGFKAGKRKGYLLKDEDGQWLALSRVCTHSNCTVIWKDGPERFECPCHHSRFSADGEVLKGPAKRPLERWSVAVDGDALIVTF